MKKLLTAVCLLIVISLGAGLFTAATVFGQATQSASNVNSGAGASSEFTVNDLLDVANINVADLSDDGRWIAATTGSLRDRIGIDNRRFGDPTYVAPSLVDVLVIDTQTAKAQRLL